LKQEHIHISYQRFAEAAALPPDEARLLEQALAATATAYSPYSRFKVGCAVLLENGEIVLGSNQENRSFPSGLCAERTALFHIGAAGKAHLIRKIAIRATSEHLAVDEPVFPCGGCRQVMVQYEELAGQPLLVLAQGATGEILRLEGIKSTLMPFSFDFDFYKPRSRG